MLPFGDRILFLVLRPPTFLVRLTGLGVFLRRKYRASTPSNAILAVTDTIITLKMLQKAMKKYHEHESTQIHCTNLL